MFAATVLKARHVLSILDFGPDEILKIVERTKSWMELKPSLSTS